MVVFDSDWGGWFIRGLVYMLVWVRMVIGMVGDGWWRIGLDGWGK